MNGDGAYFLKEQPWLEFAEKHELGVMAIHYRSNPDLMYGEARQGYYWPEQGSGEALLNAIEEHYGRSLPILIYGISGGAQFASRFVEWAPERVVVWAAYSAQFWDEPQETQAAPPGIVACGDQDGIRWFPSFSYFYQGRMLDKPWTWVSIGDTGHYRHRGFEQFVRDFFEEVLGNEQGEESHRPIYVDVDTEKTYENSYDFMQPALLAWLPSRELMMKWREIHVP